MAPRDSKRLFVDLGEPGTLLSPGNPLDQWQDHGLGLLRTILERAAVPTALLSTRAARSWHEFYPRLRGHDLLLMNVRSYSFPFAVRVARAFKQENPDGLVLAGDGTPPWRARKWRPCPSSTASAWARGETHRRPGPRARRLPADRGGAGRRAMGDWPMIDRTLGRARPAGGWPGRFRGRWSRRAARAPRQWPRS